MTDDQTYITDDGEIGSQPLTWDGQPLYSPETVKEGLFDAEAFEQQPGQTAMDPHKLYATGLDTISS